MYNIQMWLAKLNKYSNLKQIKNRSLKKFLVDNISNLKKSYLNNRKTNDTATESTNVSLTLQTPWCHKPLLLTTVPLKNLSCTGHEHYAIHMYVPLSDYKCTLSCVYLFMIIHVHIVVHEYNLCWKYVLYIGKSMIDSFKFRACIKLTKK